jgi:hypothetical protein
VSGRRPDVIKGFNSRAPIARMTAVRLQAAYVSTGPICAPFPRKSLCVRRGRSVRTRLPHSSRKVTCDRKVSLEDGGHESAVWGRSFSREERHPPSLLRKLTPLFDVRMVKYRAISTRFCTIVRGSPRMNAENLCTICVRE